MGERCEGVLRGRERLYNFDTPEGLGTGEVGERRVPCRLAQSGAGRFGGAQA